MSSKTIDSKVKKLVKRINSLPGIQTTTSCGGHNKPKITHSQVPENQFYIEFKFTTQPPTKEAWISFQTLAQLTDLDALYDWSINPSKWVKIEVCGVNEQSEILFLLHGWNTDPNDVLNVIS